MADSLRHFWFEFDIPSDDDCPRGIREGIGVTAAARDEALDLVSASVFGGGRLPPIRVEVEDVPFHTLDPWAVLPNMLEPWARGVWFPVGYR